MFNRSTSRIGVVTVTYNSAQVIDGFMISLLRQSWTDFLLYVVDNASTDATLEIIRRYHDRRICPIANRQNLGIAKGNNQGITAALANGCHSVLLINNDTEFGPLLIEQLAAGLTQHRCDMIAPKITVFGDETTIWSAGGGFNPLKGYAGFHFGLKQPDRGQFDVTRRVDHAPACCLLVRKEVFARIGKMDDLYFVYLDDTDFCFRAKLAGLTLVYLPSAKLLHKVSTLTGGPDSEFSVRYRTRNQIYFMLKHFGPWRALYYLPAFQLYQLAKLLFRKIDFAGFVLREKAFFEGLRVWRQSRLAASAAQS
jgi:GT2 family glycosyltransferase